MVHMMTSSNGNIFRVTGHLCGEFTGPGEFSAQWPVTQSLDVFFDLRLNTRLIKQSWGWWFETLSWSLWRQCNDFRLFSSDIHYTLEVVFCIIIVLVITFCKGVIYDYCRWSLALWMMHVYFIVGIASADEPAIAPDGGGAMASACTMVNYIGSRVY